MQKTILVTGASTGIGFDSTRALIAAGFEVIATVRKNEDEAHLKKVFGQKVHVIKIDVANFDAVESLPSLIKKMGFERLDGLVNNAGVAMAAPFLHQPFSEVQDMIQVNVLSLMKVTQVLLPLLGARVGEKNPGRIVNISSIAGQMAAPFLSVYAASKFAVEGFSEGLRKELLLFGIKVITIGPGTIKTPIWQKGFAVVKEKYNQTAYSTSFKRFISIALKSETNGLEVSEVSNDVVKALQLRNPAFSYAPIPNKMTNLYIPKLLPTKTLNRLTAKVLGLNPPAKVD